MPGLVASSSTNEFSLPGLVATAFVGVAWLAATAGIWMARRPPHVDGVPPTMELGPEPPAVAALLCNDYKVRTETAPATLLDLAARDVIALEEIQPGQTICRVPDSESGDTTGLAPFELHVLAALRTKAVDGVIPATALTTGTEDASASWHRQLAQLVVHDAKTRGLTEDLWPKAAMWLLGLGPFLIVTMFVVAGTAGSDADDHPLISGVATAIAIGAAIALIVIAGRVKASLVQRPLAPGTTAQSRWLGVRAHLAQNEQMEVLPPAAVKLYGRHLAYAAGFGLADHAVAALPFGEEDDHLAWSSQGGQWRRVRVRYPRIRPPAWGRHPALATAVGLFWGAGATYLLIQLATHDGRADVLFAAILTLPLVWSVWVLVTAIPDLFTTRTVTGTVIRCRARARYLSNRNEPKYWYYVAIDDGTRDRIAAYRVPEDRYRTVGQGQSVVADVSPRLGYVRTLR